MLAAVVVFFVFGFLVGIWIFRSLHVNNVFFVNKKQFAIIITSIAINVLDLKNWQPVKGNDDHAELQKKVDKILADTHDNQRRQEKKETADGATGTGHTMSSNPEGDEDDEGGDEDPEYAAERAALQNQMNTLSEDIDGITSTSAPQENPYDMVSDSNVPYELAGEQGAVGDAVAAAVAPAAPPPRAAVRTF